MWNQAVDGRYLTTSFYNIGKEVVSPWSFLSHQKPTHTPCTFIWQHCCLDCFCEWLRDSPAAQRISSPTSSEPDSSPDNSIEMQINNDHPVAAVQLQWSRQLRGHVQYRVTSEASDSGHIQHRSVEPALRSEDEDAYQPELSEGSEDEDNEDTSNLEHEHPQKGSWCKQFYSLSFLHDLGSMMLEPHQCFPLHHQGLLYCQFYNTIKEVFMASQHSPFANENLDTLALDPGLVQTWQHIGKAISHSSLALLRAYIHTKQQCHVTISNCCQQSYRTWEEYQWNINKLCTRFEMVYSLQLHTVVHWEYTQMMMMFLQCLLCVYGGQGNHLCHSSGLWLDCQVQLPPESSDTEQIQESLEMASTLELYGYAWFLDKLDWMAMTFKPPHQAHMVFNTPTLQMAYYQQYQQLIKFKSDFVLFYNVFSCMLDVCLDPTCSVLLLQLLVNLCLRVFQKNVFRSLADCVTQQPLHSARLEDACNGEIPLTCAGILQIFQHSHFWEDIQFITGSRMKVRNIEMLFAWLWGWDGNGNSDWLCKHWKSKQYWVLFHQSFDVIVSVYGTQQACEWRTIVKQTFICSHWILPYPSTAAFWACGKGGKLQSWASTHSGLVNYLQQYQPELTIIEPGMIDELPLADWKTGGQPLPLDVALPSVPSNLDAWLAIEQGQHPVPAAMSPNPAVFLLAVGVCSSKLSHHLQATMAEHHVLHSFTQKEGKSASQLHTNHKWLMSQLVLHIQALVEAERQQVQSMDLPRAT
ncbi:conserved hypothetical protein [Coccidioides posadasii str. Silveira]|uniref:Uncharacterized protein n=1 Tax=Coccidioides posadasii (strain RMSCC 757 / Silveira) TaxID=443226 RepID=E9DH18_COCPS|nr:conserved hypothetical protein [Coccidioides posadasii str. Silveira]